jgi:carbamoyltransferase
VQTVSPEQNAYLYRILEAFERRTGVPVLINTSFNLRGEPIVSSPSDALKTFFASGIDYLVLEDFVIEKEGGSSAASAKLEQALTGCL